MFSSFVFLTLLISGVLSADSGDQSVKRQATVEFQGSSGGIKLFPTNNGGSGFVQVKMGKIQEIGGKAFTVAPVTWTPVYNTTDPRGFSTFSSEFITVLPNNARFLVVAWLFETETLIKNGSLSVYVPANSVKFSIYVNDWTFETSDKTLAFDMELAGKSGEKVGRISKDDERQKRCELEGGFLDLPSIASYDGEYRDVNITLDESKSGATFVHFEFPGPVSELNYDPVLSNFALAHLPQVWIIALLALLAVVLRSY
eukprot:TRINITY_DN11892_c0_g1_i1.p1 TRINITY_DN11892_c0_g1~~TRINITY_DN11892_c0_g1_i1.p1  ORF type:complete len:257 (+),score=54.67 TRINITY_DN11892_c0_g1_i1:50-820(+)